MTLPACIRCKSEFTYQDQSIFICPECGHEWTEQDMEEEQTIVKDSLGNTLEAGDSITVIKDLKVKGSSSVIKVGTKIKNIRLIDGDHSIECKVGSLGTVQITPKYVKKA